MQRLVKIISNKWTYFVILGMFIVVPAGIQFFQVYFDGKTPHGDWLGFWGSYLGIIPSGLIAYFVAKTQIDYQTRIEDQRRQRENDLNNLEKMDEIVVYLYPWYATIKLLGQLKKQNLNVDMKMFSDFYSQVNDDIEFEYDYYNSMVKLSKRLRRFETISKKGTSFAKLYQQFFWNIAQLNFSLRSNGETDFSEKDFEKLGLIIEDIITVYDELSGLLEKQINETAEKS